MKIKKITAIMMAATMGIGCLPFNVLAADSYKQKNQLLQRQSRLFAPTMQKTWRKIPGLCKMFPIFS